MNLNPLYDKVVVKREEKQEKKGNLYMPDNAQKKPIKGTVVAVGPGMLLQDGSLADMPLKVGDKVIFSSYGGAEIEINDEELLVLSANEVLAVVK